MNNSPNNEENGYSLGTRLLTNGGLSLATAFVAAINGVSLYMKYNYGTPGPMIPAEVLLPVFSMASLTFGMMAKNNHSEIRECEAIARGTSPTPPPV